MPIGSNLSALSAWVAFVLVWVLNTVSSPFSWAVLPSILDAPVELMMTDEPVPAALDTIGPSLSQPVPSLQVDANTDPLTDLTRRLSDDIMADDSVEVMGADEPPPAIFKGSVREAADASSGSTLDTVMANKGFKPLEEDVLRQAQRIQKQHHTIEESVRDEDHMAAADISVLWQTAVERSGTIRFAIEKLSRKNAVGQVPEGEAFSSRLLKSLVRVGGVAGTVMTGTPAGMLGGNMVEQMLQQSPTTSALTRVTDADMLLLAKEVAALQSDLIGDYYVYRHAKSQWMSARASQHELEQYLSLLPESHRQAGKASSWDPMVPLLESLRTTMDDTVMNAHREYQAARQALSLLVGPNAIDSLEEIKEQAAASTS